MVGSRRYFPNPEGEKIRLPHRLEGGIVLLGILVGMFVMAVLLMAAVQPASTLIMRDREKELLFRGHEYAEAIRRYRKENGGGFPSKLEDLLKPGGPKRIRYIRHAYPNPMDPKGKWGLLAPGSTIIKTDENGKTTYTPVGAPGDSKGGVPRTPVQQNLGKGPQQGQGVKVLPFRLDGKEGQPILGVYCKKHKKAFSTFMGKDYYDEWYFSPLVIKETRIIKTNQGQQPGGQPGRPGTQGNPGTRPSGGGIR